ncbi:hypothetical protein [Deinococcus fonticola]|uniref:hypothetical protein n=1 Tax=Deinococcus fonticola TaxID=2528713 RepID=UPI001074E6B6|nr:hypothetical protein [Deinococcus fonticola]
MTPKEKKEKQAAAPRGDYPPERMRGLEKARAEGRTAAGPNLKPGEATTVARVRGRSEAIEWWNTLSPLQRGDVVNAAHEQSEPVQAERGERISRA